MRIKHSAGEVYNNWTILSYNKETKKWLAKCKCGLQKEVWLDHLITGKSKSCSCMKGTHKMSKEPVYRSWLSMVSRCNLKTNDRYYQYGGRGIRVCEKWLNFEGFYEDMGKRPKGCSIDRIDVDGNYCKENCRWATNSEQMRNRRDSKLRGYCIAELESNVSYAALQSRLKRGWSFDKAINYSNTKENIEALSSKNKSGFKNISFCKRTNSYAVQIGRDKWLGRHKTLHEAVMVRDNYLKSKQNDEYIKDEK